MTPSALQLSDSGVRLYLPLKTYFIDPGVNEVLLAILVISCLVFIVFLLRKLSIKTRHLIGISGIGSFLTICSLLFYRFNYGGTLKWYRYGWPHYFYMYNTEHYQSASFNEILLHGNFSLIYFLFDYVFYIAVLYIDFFTNQKVKIDL